MWTDSAIQNSWYEKYPFVIFLFKNIKKFNFWKRFFSVNWKQEETNFSTDSVHDWSKTCSSKASINAYIILRDFVKRLIQEWNFFILLDRKFFKFLLRLFCGFIYRFIIFILGILFFRLVKIVEWGRMEKVWISIIRCIWDYCSINFDNSAIF